MEIFVLEVTFSCVFSWSSHHNKDDRKKQEQLFIAYSGGFLRTPILFDRNLQSLMGIFLKQ